MQRGKIAAMSLGLMGAWSSMALAATPPTGTAYQMAEVQNLGATGWDLVTTTVIALAGVGLATAGLSSKLSSRTGNIVGPISGPVYGIGLQFVPAIITGAQKLAPAATGWLAPVSPWLTQWQGLTGQSLWINPVFWLAFGLTLYATKQAQKHGVHV